MIEHFLLPISPIAALIVTACLLIGLECFPKLKAGPLKAFVAISGLVAGLVFTAFLWKNGASFTVAPSGSAPWLIEFAKFYRLDVTSCAFFAGILVFTLFSIVFLDAHFEKSDVRGEIYTLALFIASGMMLLVSSENLLMIFVGLELMSLPTYVLVGIYRQDRNSCEAALKYFLFGSFASVLLILGIALLYAQFGTFQMPEISKLIAGSVGGEPASKALVLCAMMLITVATAFKVGVVPFHMWVPDVYQGAPSAVTGFMGSAIKLAGFGLASRLLWGMFLPLAGNWSHLLDILAVVTMFVGNTAALAQDNLKRMFAYSSVSHAGFLLLGISTVGQGPHIGPLYFYLITYGLMFLGIFAILSAMEDQTKSTDIFQLSGMGFTHPVLAACFTLFAISAAGIPPTAGFFAKYSIFLEAIRSGKTLVVVLAALSSLIGVYYYLRVVVYLYMKESKERLAFQVKSRVAFFCIVLCAATVLYFGIAPNCLEIGAR